MSAPLYRPDSDLGRGMSPLLVSLGGLGVRSVVHETSTRLGGEVSR